jgi:hypothetical protein
MTSTLPLAAVAGAAAWTFLEYVIHRWLGHHPRLRGNPFGVEHVRHHSEGNYFAPNRKKAAAAAWSRSSSARPRRCSPARQAWPSSPGS